MIKVSNSLWFLLSLTLCFSSWAKSNPLKLEIICPQSYSPASKKVLCPENEKKCRWSLLNSSQRASSWSKRGQLKVIENPLVKGIKIEIKNRKLSGLKAHWCFKNEQFNLPKSGVLNQLRRNHETLYLLQRNDIQHLPRLKAIKHPCRVLKKLPSDIKNFFFYYLEPQDLKACRMD